MLVKLTLDNDSAVQISKRNVDAKEEISSTYLHEFVYTIFLALLLYRSVCKT